MDASIDNSSDVRLQALKSLHMILQEKDQNVQTYKEKASRYERALQQAESRIAKLMQLHAGAAATAGSEVWRGQCNEQILLAHPSHPASQSSESSSSSSNSTQMPSSSSTFTASAPLSPGQSAAQSAATANSHLSRNYKSRLVTDNATSAQRMENNNVNRETPDSASFRVFSTYDSNDLQTDGDTPTRLSRTTGTGISMLPGVSRTVFDNAVKENVRLKKMLQEVLQKDGSSVKVFLERQEYADVIKQLRTDLCAKQQHVDEIESWITMHKAGENQQILVQMLELQKRAQLLTKEGQVKTAMVDNCLKENDKLRNEITALKSQQTTTGEQRVLHNLKDQIEQLQKQLEEERRKHHQQIQTLMETAPERVASSSSPNNDLESLKAKVAELEGQLKDEKEKNQLQKEQLHSFEEDFQVNLKQHREKSDKELLRLQDKIRSISKEKQKLEKDYLAEKQRSQMFEGLISKYAPDYFKSTGGALATTCAQEMREPWMSHSTQPPSILVQDGPPSLPKQSKKKGEGAARKNTSGVTRSSSGGASASHPVTEGEFECPRCQRTSFRNVDHFRDHCSKCAQ